MMEYIIWVIWGLLWCGIAFYLGERKKSPSSKEFAKRSRNEK